MCAGLEGVRRYVQDEVRKYVAKSEQDRAAHLAERAYPARLHPEHYIRRFNKDVRRVVLPPIGGEAQVERGLFACKVRGLDRTVPLMSALRLPVQVSVACLPARCVGCTE